MKKIGKFLMLLILTAAFLGCNSQLSLESESQISFNEERKEQLARYAITGDYSLTEDEVSENLISFLSLQENSSRSAISNDYTIKKINTESLYLDSYIAEENRSPVVEKNNNIDFYLYEISNNSNSSSGYAVLSNDRRIGEIISIIEEDEFVSDISDFPFMQLFCTELEEYIYETAEIWNSLTEEDLNNARSAYADIASSGSYRFSNWVYNSGNIDNILKTKWKQSTPYNEGIKAIKGKNYLTGCGAVAVAQVMAFHEFPENCSSVITKELNKKWDEASSWDGKYNWDAMKANPYAGSLTSDGKMMVGAFLYHVAEGIKSSYGTEETSSYSHNYSSFLKSEGYKADQEQAYSFKVIENSIDNKCPVIISGASIKNSKTHKFLWWTWETVESYKGGHAWVIDGYCNMTCTATNKNNENDIQTFSADYVHCNLGWSGSGNGYYISNVFSVNRGPVASDYRVEKLNRSSYGEKKYYQFLLEIIPHIKPSK